MKKQNKSKLAVRVMAWILSALMVLGLATTAIIMIINATKKDDDTKKEAAIEQTVEQR